MRCTGCKEAVATRHASFRSHVGLVYGRVHRRSVGFFCPRCYEAEYRTHQMTNVLLGWWSVVAFFATLALLPANAFAHARGRRVPAIDPDAPADSDAVARAQNAGLWLERGSWFFGGAVVASLLAILCAALLALQAKPRFEEESMARGALVIGTVAAGGLGAWLFWCAFHPSSWRGLHKNLLASRAPVRKSAVRRRPRADRR